MKILSLIVVFLCVNFVIVAQGEGVGPLMANPHLQKNYKKGAQLKSNASFDSTFIYTSDTVSLPFFDEFSTNKFQVYADDVNGVGVTSDEVFRLLNVNDVVLPENAVYTEQVTFRREVTVGNATYVDTPLEDTIIKVGDLSSYPVTHVPTTVYPPFYIYDTVDLVGDVTDTIWIVGPEIFQDSATQFFAPIDDQELIWLDHQAYHNFSMAQDPWSLGVVTFDGLDENGFPYAIGSTITNYADMLTSKPIDMSGVSAGDSCYFSFIWQEEGLCDPPEGGDSLILEFYAEDLDQWKWIWSTGGGNGSSEFRHEHFKIDNPDYFKKGFQLRFRNYGGLSGSLDHFHIDYVDLDIARGYQDTVIHDLAFVYPLYTLLDSYTSVPWDHYKNNFSGKMSSNVEVSVRNSDVVPQIEQDGTTDIEYNSAIEGSFTLLESLLTSDLNYLPMTTYFSYHDFSTGDRYDETKPGYSEEFNIVSRVTSPTSNEHLINDSTSTIQEFVNYYSYDDGTAEQAYGPTGIQSRLAIKYTPYEADSLLGAYMHFVPSVDDVSNNLFILTVWDDNNGEPGNVIYQDNDFFPRQPHYEYDRNLFTPYYFADSLVPVDGTFYIGWRQFEAQRLGVGLDRNIVNNDKTFYSNDFGNTWNQSGIPGSVMIRPIFSTSYNNVIAGVEEAEREINIQLYPNPTSSVVNIEVSDFEYKGVDVFNVQGLQVLSSHSQSVDMSNHPNGVYFFKVKGSPKTYKIIKQ